MVSLHDKGTLWDVKIIRDMIFSCEQAALKNTSFRLSVRLSHLFDNVAVILSSWNFQELLPLTDVISMQKVKVKGQGHRGHDPI